MIKVERLEEDQKDDIGKGQNFDDQLGGVPVDFEKGGKLNKRPCTRCQNSFKPKNGERCCKVCS